MEKHQSKEYKPVFVNQETYDKVVEKLGYVPENLTVNNFLPDNQAVILNDTPGFAFKPIPYTPSIAEAIEKPLPFW